MKRPRNLDLGERTQKQQEINELLTLSVEQLAAMVVEERRRANAEINRLITQYRTLSASNNDLRARHAQAVERLEQIRLSAFDQRRQEKLAKKASYGYSYKGRSDSDIRSYHPSNDRHQYRR